MTTISTTADLLRLLREDPDFRDQVRSLLLTQELIELPERFARFEAYVIQRFEDLESSMERQFTEVRGDITEIRGDITVMQGDITVIQGDITEIRGDITVMQGDITVIQGDITEIRGDITVIQGDITVMQGDIGRLRGAEYERRIGRSFASYASMAFRQRHDRRLRRNRLLYSNILGRDSGFEELIADAADNGLISDDERGELEQADSVMMGQDGDATVYFVGEFSITVNHMDIDRAIARSAILSKATGSDVWPMVIGDTIPELQRARAEAEQVAFRVIEE